MTILILCLLGFLIFFSFLIDRNIKSPMVLFSLIWGIILFLSSLRLYNIISINSNIYLMIIIGTVCFFIGCLLVSTKKFKSENIKLCNDEKLDKIMTCLEMFALIIFCISSFTSLRLLDSGYSINDIYKMRIAMSYGVKTAISGNYLTNVLLEYFARPILAISMAYSTIKLIRDKKKSHFIITVLMLILSFVNRGNRLDILCFIISLGLAFSIYNKKDYFSFKQKRRTIILGIIIVFFGIYIYNLRGQSNLSQTIYMYLCGNVPLFSVKYQEFLTSNSGYTIFATSLQGICRLINQLVEILGFNSINLMNLGDQYANVETAKVITTNGGIFNAFIGIFYFFYCDLGWLGIILYSFINGLISEYVYKRSVNNGDTIIMILYIIIMVRGIILSCYNYLLASIMYGVAIVLLYFINKIVKNNKVKNEMEN